MTNKNVVIEDAAVENVHAGEDLGSILKAARLERKLSQQDVSNTLRYSIKQIDALENNAFDILPAPMMTRGFIRSYAKYLQVDAEPLLAAYRDSLGDDPQGVISVKSSMQPVSLSNASMPWLKYILATLLVLLFLLAWMAYVEYLPKQAGQADPDLGAESETKLPPMTESPNSETLPEAALPEAERAPASDSSVEQNDVMPAPVSNGANNVINISADANIGALGVQSAPVAPTSQPVANLQATGKSAKSVTLKFSGQSWVSIMDKSGKVIFEKLYHAGDVDTKQLTPPLNLVVGNASDTKLTFSGQEINLAAKSKNNVARITLE